MDGLISGGGGQSGILRYIVLLYSGSGISIKTVLSITGCVFVFVFTHLVVLLQVLHAFIDALILCLRLKVFTGY